MARIQGRHEISVIGATTQQAYTNAVSVVTLVSDIAADAPATFLIMATTDCYVIQGAAGVTVTSTTGMLLNAGTYMRITVTKTANASLAVTRSSTNGTLYITRNDDETP